MRPLTAVLTSAAMLSMVTLSDTGTPDPVVIWAACIGCKPLTVEPDKSPMAVAAHR